MKKTCLSVVFIVVLSNVCFAQTDTSITGLDLSLFLPRKPIPSIDSSVLAKANAGDAESQYQIGMYWLENEGKEKGIFILSLPGDENRHKKALEWFEKAAAQGHKEALIEAGMIYETRSLGLNGKAEWNKKQAISYLIQGGAEEDPVLMMHLASLVGSDKESLIWCDKAISKGLPKNEDAIPKSRRLYKTTLGGAYYYKALIYLGEKDVPQDYVKYFENLVLAEKNGYKKALIEIGECYFQGWGVKQDKAKAIEIWNSLKEEEEYKYDIERMEEKYLGIKSDKSHLQLKDEETQLREWLEENR